MAKSIYRGVFDATKSYPIYSIVNSTDAGDSTLMISTQDVPVGSDITDANYWITYNVANVNMLGASGGLTPEEVQEMIEDYVGLIEELDFEADDIVDAINYVNENACTQADWEQSDNTAIDYIKNKPTIPDPQVQADWNESDTTSPAYIENKPTIPEPQVQADWNESDTTSPAYIENKPTIPAEVPIATTSVAGKVKPDGTTITVDVDGVISSVGGNDKWFEIIFGTTTKGEVKSAIENGKNIYAKYSENDETHTFIMHHYTVSGNDITSLTLYTLRTNSSGSAPKPRNTIMCKDVYILLTGSDSDVITYNVVTNRYLVTDTSTSWKSSSSYRVGLVAVDGSTITVDSNGVISAVGGGSSVQADWAETDSADDSFIQNKPFDVVSETNIISGDTLEYSAQDSTDFGHTIYVENTTAGSFTLNVGDKVKATYGNTTVEDTIADFQGTKVTNGYLTYVSTGVFPPTPAIIFSFDGSNYMMLIADDTLPTTTGNTITVSVDKVVTTKLPANKINIGKGLINDNGVLISKGNRFEEVSNTNSLTVPYCYIRRFMSVSLDYDGQGTYKDFYGTPEILPASNDNYIITDGNDSCKIEPVNTILDPIYDAMITYKVTEVTVGGVTYTDTDFGSVEMHFVGVA